MVKNYNTGTCVLKVRVWDRYCIKYFIAVITPIVQRGLNNKYCIILFIVVLTPIVMSFQYYKIQILLDVTGTV